MILWLNGTFGAGKTTTATLLTAVSPRLRIFDPEWVGYLLRANLGDHPVSDFRHWESWRVLTPVVADELVRVSGQSLVAPQTVLEEGYWDEVLQGLSQRGHEVFHVLLDADPDVLRHRIEDDRVEAGARSWRIEHLAAYAAARPWLVRRADLVVDTSQRTPEQVADRVWVAARDGVGEPTTTG